MTKDRLKITHIQRAEIRKMFSKGEIKGQSYDNINC